MEEGTKVMKKLSDLKMEEGTKVINFMRTIEKYVNLFVKFDQFAPNNMIIEQVINILLPSYDNLVNVISNEKELPSLNEFTGKLPLEETHNGNCVRTKVNEAILMVKFQKILKNKLVVHDAQFPRMKLLAMYYKVKFELKNGYCKNGDIGPSIVPTLTTLSKKQANVVILDNNEKSVQDNLKPQLGTQSGTLYH
jgi:hypothetical protein